MANSPNGDGPNPQEIAEQFLKDAEDIFVEVDAEDLALAEEIEDDDTEDDEEEK